MAWMVLSGCVVSPQRPYVQSRAASAVCEAKRTVEPSKRTPESPVDNSYTLHFVEFDDQGWLFPDGADPVHPEGTPSKQIDCAVADLAGQLSAGQQVLSFVYVHGWKHSADHDDPDVKRFRELLGSRAKLFPGRQIVGIYVGWQGRTIDLPLLKELTFWGRKNAANHVAEGRVRELFSRIKGLRDYWNGPREGLNRTQDCDWEPTGEDKCSLRTIMIGHSFGGLILYNSAAPYLLEMLSATRDIPAGLEPAKARRARGIADLIVLLNPAFEGSRYESLYQASQHYQPSGREPPILVMITSTADLATKNAFPVARWFNSIFQYPSSSDDESEAMRRTPGHTDRYLTHDLCVENADCRAIDPEAGSETGKPWSGSRRFCGGLILRRFSSAPFGDKSIVWNVRTNGEIIRNHSDIVGKYVFRFVEQVYGDVAGTSNTACLDSYRSPSSDAED